VPVSAEVRRGLETRRELAEEAQHCGQVLGAVARHGFLQEQSGLHGNNLGQYSRQRSEVTKTFKEANAR